MTKTEKDKRTVKKLESNQKTKLAVKTGVRAGKIFHPTNF
jgi:hypothetical protein